MYGQTQASIEGTTGEEGIAATQKSVSNNGGKKKKKGMTEEQF